MTGCTTWNASSTIGTAVSNEPASSSSTRARQWLATASARLESLSPLNVLARGYSLTRVEQSPSLLRSPAQVQPGDRLITIVEQGRIVSRVESTNINLPPVQE